MHITELGMPPLAPATYECGLKVVFTKDEFRLLQAIAQVYLYKDNGENDHAKLAREIRDFETASRRPHIKKELRSVIDLAENSPHRCEWTVTIPSVIRDALAEIERLEKAVASSEAR